MSICNCPVVGIDGVEDPKQKALVATFLKSLGEQEWSLLSLADMARAGNDLATISEIVPFRGGPCARSRRCCGMCTRQCYHRCVQDCLHRLYMWKKLVASSPADVVPLNIRLIATQKFYDHAQLSWVVGDILSRNTNSKLKEYMDNASLRTEENPYKIDYSPQVELDPRTGRRRCDPISGELCIMHWPRSGLCPYCLPNVVVDRRVLRKQIARRAKG